MLRAIRRKLWVLLAVPVGLLVVLFALLARDRRAVFLESEATAELREQVTLLEVATFAATAPGEDPSASYRKAIEGLRMRGERTRGLALFDREGNLLEASEVVRSLSGSLAEVARRAATEGAAAEQTVTVGSGRWLARAVPIQGPQGDALTIAVLARDLAYVDSLLRAFDRELFLIGLVAFMLTMLVVALVIRQLISRPAQAILDRADHISRGELQGRVPEDGAEEMARVARAMNTMADSLIDARVSHESSDNERATVEHRLRRTQITAAINHIADEIAHELGSPLNTILGRARLAAAYPGCPEDIRAALETIATQCERITRVVAEVLAASRSSRQLAGRCDLARVARRTLEFLEPECRRHRVLSHLECTVIPAYVDLDDERAFQVLFNLCLSALEAQPSGGEVIFRIFEDSARGSADKRIILEVEDRRRSDPPALMDHIADALAVQGDGAADALSLAITRGLIIDAGGSMELRRAVQGGSMCHVTFPKLSKKRAPMLSAEVGT